MVRQTSMEAYQTIKESGLLSNRRFQVYDVLFNNGPLTGAQVATIMKGTYGIHSQSETIRNRLTELRDMGCIQECGEAVDQYTNMKVILWDVTDKLPMKLQKKKKKETFTICKAHRMFVADDMTKCTTRDLFGCCLVTVYEK